MDVHLMIVDPDRYIKTFAQLGSNNLTVHYEACTHLHRTLQAIKAEGMKAGVAINPHTSIKLLEDTIQDIDIVIVMSVNPGFGGQKFIESTLEKVKLLRKEIDEKKLKVQIEIDGGINFKSSKMAKKAGVDILVSGTTIFKENEGNLKKNIQLLRTG